MTYYGQHREDEYINQLFNNKKNGICVEVGAYNGVNASNTYFFELNGWRSLCIEPIPLEFEKCKKFLFEKREKNIS